jgi:energy-coupling factor transport system ATP-binding protein
VIFVPGGAQPLVVGSPGTVMATSPVAPPVVRLGRLAEWDPLPLSVRDARRQAGDLRARLHAQPVRAQDIAIRRPPVVAVDRTQASYGAVHALRGVTLDVAPGEIVALMGRNGAGKSTLLSTLVGLRRPNAGTVRIDGVDPATLTGPRLIGRVGLVPQDSSDLLSRDSVAAECADADRDADVDPGSAARLLHRLAPEIPLDAHPRDLSEGQRLVLALAVILVSTPAVILLDEPTRGLDYPTKDRLSQLLRDLAESGHAIVVATHDVELAAETATRVVVLADGEVVADGPTADVVVGSPLFAPQVAKVLVGPDFDDVPLTVTAVRTALAVTG